MSAIELEKLRSSFTVRQLYFVVGLRKCNVNSSKLVLFTKVFFCFNTDRLGAVKRKVVQQIKKS